MFHRRRLVDVFIGLVYSFDENLGGIFTSTAAGAEWKLV